MRLAAGAALGLGKPIIPSAVSGRVATTRRLIGTDWSAPDSGPGPATEVPELTGVTRRRVAAACCCQAGTAHTVIGTFLPGVGVVSAIKRWWPCAVDVASIDRAAAPCIRQLLINKALSSRGMGEGDQRGLHAERTVPTHLSWPAIRVPQAGVTAVGCRLKVSQSRPAIGSSGVAQAHEGAPASGDSLGGGSCGAPGR